MSNLIWMLLLGIGAMIVVFWLVKNIVKAAIVGAIILILIGLIYGFMIYSDFSDIKSNFSTKDKAFILSDNDRLITGIVIKKLKINGTPDILAETSLAQMQANFSDKDYKSMLGDKYRMFIIDIDALEQGLPEYVNLSERMSNISRKRLLRMIESEDPIIEYGEGASAQDLGIDASKPYDARAILFGLAFSNVMDSQGPRFLVSQYLLGNVITYPETAAFKNLDAMPGFLKDGLVKALSGEP